MPSLLAWVDYSEEHRRRMREVIDLFREQDTVDELGIGSVRDAFANILFPGLSTIQTRARYFLFVPWLYMDMEHRRVPSHRAANEARRLQTKLIIALEAGGATANQGIIGWFAREALKRLPASVYWGGLGAFRIRRFAGSIEDYHRSLNGHYRRLREHQQGDGYELHARPPTNWSPSLPAAPQSLLEATSIRLRPEDSAFLLDGIVTTQPGSLLAALLHNPRVHDSATPWDLPEVAGVGPELQEVMGHARKLALVMHGAALAYNLMLARLALRHGMAGTYADLAERHEHALNEWAAEAAATARDIEAWDLVGFWQTARGSNPRIPYGTERFITEWIRLARTRLDEVPALTDRVRRIIGDREVALKRSQARLTSLRALERWSGEAGTRRLDFRWPTARQMIADIAEGLTDA